MKKVRQQGLRVSALVGLCLVAYVGYVLGQNSRRSLPQSVKPGQVSAPRPVPAVSLKEPEARMRQEDGHTIRPGLFAPPSSEEPVPPPTANSADHTEPPRDMSPQIPAAADPLADYVYNGRVSDNDETVALIEHRRSKQGWLVREGEDWLDYRILEVNEQEVRVLADGQIRTLPKSDAINLTPLLSEEDRIRTAAKSPASAKSKKAEKKEQKALQSRKKSSKKKQKGLSEAEIAQIKDAVFEGSLSGEEAERLLAKEGKGKREKGKDRKQKVKGMREIGTDVSP